jgi:hypothetical protein
MAAVEPIPMAAFAMHCQHCQWVKQGVPAAARIAGNAG